MISQLFSQTCRYANKFSTVRFCVFPPLRLLPTCSGTSRMAPFCPLREYSRTAPVESSTVEKSPTSTVSGTSESAAGGGPEIPVIKTVPITYVESDGREKTVPAEIGKHLLDVAHDNKVDLEGACGGELSCSTCHLIFEPHVYATLPPKTDEEQDMLDLAYAVTETSRLGCQIRVTEALAGIKVQIPDDGF